MSVFWLLFYTTTLAVPPVYEGKPLNIAKDPFFTLYKGAEPELVGSGLDARAAADVIADGANIWWLETEIAIPKAFRDAQDIWLFVKSDISAFEISINRHSIIENGRVGLSAEEEERGNYIVSRQIPRQWIKTGDEGRDRNKILIRFSNFQFPKGTHFFDISVGPNGLNEIKTGPWVYGPLLLCGVFLLAICINLSFFVAFKRQPSFLLLTGLFTLCFWAMAEDILLHRFPMDVAFRHQYHMGVHLDYAAFMLLILLLAWEFRELFTKQPARGIWFLPLAGIAMVGLTANHPLHFFWISLLPLAIALVAWSRGLANGRLLSFSLIPFCGLVLGDEANLLDGLTISSTNFVITSVFYYLDYIGFALLAFVMVIASAGSIIQQNRFFDQTQLRASRLELELLLKHLHPHFLLNSLMALQHLLETDRKQAVTFVDALAEELQLLRVMSKRALVTLDEEIKICQIHLKIMNMQKRADFRLTVAGVEGSETIPPAVLHTLVENGLTHGYAGRNEGQFRLTKEMTSNAVRYRLYNDSLPQESDLAPTSGSGTGLAYVRARLEEAYPGRWQFRSVAVSGGWEAVVEVLT